MLVRKKQRKKLPGPSVVRNLLQPGNTKLGPGVWTFSIPAIKTCPGRTALCESLCYATRGHFTHTSVRNAHAENLKATRLRSFVRRVVDEIRRRGVKVLRVHVAGDFYSAAYAQSWLLIMKACPETRFFIFSRSWRLPAVEAVLVKMAALSNVRVHYSLDREMGLPLSVPPQVRLAYMAVDDQDTPPHAADLAFIDRPMRHRRIKHMNGVLVCPVESVGADITCTKCQLCFASLHARDPRRYKRAVAAAPNLVPLPVVQDT